MLGIAKIKSGVLDVRMPMTLGMHGAGDISFVGLEIGILDFATDNRVGKYGLRACPLFPINAFGLNYETCVK